MALLSLALMIMASVVIALVDRIVRMVVVMVMIVVVVVIMGWSRSSSRGNEGCASSGGDGGGGGVVVIVAMVVLACPLLQDIEVLSKGSVRGSPDLERALRGGEGCGRDEENSGQRCGF